MPSIDDNRRRWDRPDAWAGAADQWSEAWGGAAWQWHASLRPRLRGVLPTGTILEIGPGDGRWAAFLIEQADRYVGVDLSATCIEACRQRFSGVATAEFHTNDGRSLDAVGAGTVDVAFSFDALVHVDHDDVAAYLRALATVLAPDGIAVLHHSNAADRPRQVPDRVPGPLRPWLVAQRRVGPTHWRAPDMSALTFEGLARAAGLHCIGQEIVDWAGVPQLDCISVVARPGSRWDRPHRLRVNDHFSHEAASAAAAAAVYPVGQAEAAPRDSTSAK